MARREKREKRPEDRYFWVFLMMFFIQGLVVMSFWGLGFLSGPTDFSFSHEDTFYNAMSIASIAFLITVITLAIYIIIKRRDYIFWLFTLPAILIHGYLALLLARSEGFRAFLFLLSLPILLVPKYFWGLGGVIIVIWVVGLLRQRRVF